MPKVRMPKTKSKSRRSTADIVKSLSRFAVLKKAVKKAGEKKGK